MSSSRTDAARKMQNIGIEDIGENKSTSHEHEVVFIVEDKVFEETIRQFMKSMFNLDNILVHSAELSSEKGRENTLLSLIRLTLSKEQNANIICLVDANDSAKKQRESIIKILSDFKYKLYANVHGNAVLAENDMHNKVGIWIMPNNKDVGSFADFYFTLARIEPEVRQYINDTIDGLKKKNIIKHKKSLVGTVKYFTYLAWQKNPLRSNDDMFSKKKFLTTAQLYTDFASWIQQIL